MDYEGSLLVASFLLGAVLPSFAERVFFADEEFDVAPVSEAMHTEFRDVRPTECQEFPSIRSELRSEIGGVRSELRSEIGGVRSELRSDIPSVRRELRTNIGSVRSELRSDIDRWRRVLTTESGKVWFELGRMRRDINDLQRELAVANQHYNYIRDQLAQLEPPN